MNGPRTMPTSKRGQPVAPDGKIVDFIDGKLRADSETEQVRQDFERTLIEEYRHRGLGVDVRLGSGRLSRCPEEGILDRFPARRRRRPELRPSHHPNARPGTQRAIPRPAPLNSNG